MRDPETVASIGAMVIVGILSLTLIAGLACLIYSTAEEREAKLDCRRAGSIVVTDKDSEWHCAKPTPERAP